MEVTVKDAMFLSPNFGKGVCSYAKLVEKHKGLAGNCPAFKEGCPFKKCKTVGEFVEKMTQMRDMTQGSKKGKDAIKKFIQDVIEVSKEEQRKLGVCPFMAHSCPFSHDAQGKPIIPK